MSSEIQPVMSQPQPTEITPEITTTSVTEAATGTAQIAIASMSDLKTASPALFKAITTGIMMRIKHQMDASQQRIKEILSEERSRNR